MKTNNDYNNNNKYKINNNINEHYNLFLTWFFLSLFLLASPSLSSTPPLCIVKLKAT